MKIAALIPMGAALTLGSAMALAQAPQSARPASPPPAKAMVVMSPVLASSNLERSIAFYTKGMGMTAIPVPNNPTEVNLALPGGGINLMLQTSSTPNAPLPARGTLNRVILEVPDLDGLAARLKTAGYGLKGAIRRVEQYKVAVAFLEDPDGNVFELVQRGQ